LKYLRLILIVMLAILITGCSGGSQESKNTYFDSDRKVMMLETKHYLLQYNPFEDNGKRSAESMRIILKNYKSEDADKFNEILGFMEKENFDAVSSLYIELGGETVAKRELSDIEKNNLRIDKQYGHESLSSAQLYLDDMTTSLTRTSISNKITENLVGIKKKSKEDFGQLARYINLDDRKRAKQIYDSLCEMYEFVPKNLEESIESNSLIDNKDEVKNLRNVISELDVQEVKNKIKENAKEKWEDDYRMQKYEVNKQTEAFEQMITITVQNDDVETILTNAFSEWGNDFNMVRYEYNKQMKAYNEIASLNLESDNEKKILSRAMEKWKNDFNMVMYEFDKQIKASNSLNK